METTFLCTIIEVTHQPNATRHAEPSDCTTLTARIIELAEITLLSQSSAVSVKDTFLCSFHH